MANLGRLVSKCHVKLTLDKLQGSPYPPTKVRNLIAWGEEGNWGKWGLIST